MREVYIHGFKVLYDETAKEGINYLRDDLGAEETKVFFNQAKLKKSAFFEDDNDRNFILSYNNGNSYTLIRKT